MQRYMKEKNIISSLFHSQVKLLDNFAPCSQPEALSFKL